MAGGGWGGRRRDLRGDVGEEDGGGRESLGDGRGSVVVPGDIDASDTVHVEIDAKPSLMIKRNRHCRRPKCPE